MKENWIWQNDKNNPDEFVKFFDEFDYIGGTAYLDISCDSNYVVFIGGVMAAFGQYPDYPHYKIYDKIDITRFLKAGKNKIAILCWYYGVGSLTYKIGDAGLYFKVYCENTVLAYSSENTKCTLAKDYQNYRKKIITSQLGLSYRFDSNGYDGFFNNDFAPLGFNNAVVKTRKNTELLPRPIKRLELKETNSAVLINKEKHIYDLRCETSGFLHIKFKADKGAILNVSYGEHLEGGEVNRLIGRRDFSVELIANGEMFEFCDYFRRLGGRYLQVSANGGFEIEFIGIKEVYYPVNIKPFKLQNELTQKIYDVSVRTLHLCMHDHYEDTPWREQALYTMDSRNQMLCGYYAFEEFTFARASLKLIGQGQRKDGMLPICFPSEDDFGIPYFSLIYIIQMNEYALYSGDFSLAREYKDNLSKILDAFVKRIENNNLISNLQNEWNFYEWADEPLSGSLDFSTYKKSYDLPLNCFLIIALQNYKQLCENADLKNNYLNYIEPLQKAVFNTFYDSEKQCFKTFIGNNENHYSRLANSLAVLAGACNDNEKTVCKKIADRSSGLVDITLSMKCFEYDALYKTDKSYAKFILDEIEKNYSHMLSCGATSFWETIKGYADFSNAGSLCHGWSAIPVYYYNILKE